MPAATWGRKDLLWGWDKAKLKKKRKPLSAPAQHISTRADIPGTSHTSITVSPSSTLPRRGEGLRNGVAPATARAGVSLSEHPLNGGNIPKTGATFPLLGTGTCSTDVQCREPAKLSQPFLLPMPDLSGV